MPAKRDLKVLMIGPGASPPGGITSLVEIILPLLHAQVRLEYFGTSVISRPFYKTGKLSTQNVILALAQYARFLGVAIRFRPHILHIHTSQGFAWLKDSFYVLAGRLIRAKVVIHVHAASFDHLYSRRSGFEQRYTKAVFRLASAVIALSPAWAECLRQISPYNVLILPNCVDTDRIQPAEATPKDLPAALFLGSLGQRKGIWDLLNAWILVNQGGVPLALWLAGSDEEQGTAAKIKDIVQGYEFRDLCCVLGPVTGPDKIALLQKAAFLALPSYYEGLPMAVIEALAAGLPVLSTRVGGVPDLVKEGENGYLTAPGEVTRLAENMSRLAQQPGLRRQMGYFSRQLALRCYGHQAYIAQLTGLYQQLAG